jgi:HD superfamily phosphohydrolase
MEKLNEEFDGELNLAIQIFKGAYERPFFHQLVSSQLDIDRMDYLNRDSFFTGVTEGLVSADRIIKMLEIVNDEIVIAEKGIYSVENFLNSRRLMYWQVYLHKTTICAEEMLIQIVKRAKFLIQNGEKLETTPALMPFFKNNYTNEDFNSKPKLIANFGKLDDYDVWSGIKLWIDAKDPVLKMLCNMLMDRHLFKILLFKEEIGSLFLEDIDAKICKQYAISQEDLPYLRVKGMLSNYGYIASGKRIKILKKNGEIVDISEASDLPNIKAISEVVKKYYLCIPNLTTEN